MGAYPSGANGFATVDPRSPRSWGVCDRDGFRHNRNELFWQYEWAGVGLRNKRILVCRRCLDIPNPQLRSYSPPPDPIPIRDPRPDQSYQGLAPIVVTTVANVLAQRRLTATGIPMTDAMGNPLYIASTGSFGTLIGPGTGRTLVNFDLPPSFGLWLNPTGGVCFPGAANCVFYAPNSYYEVFGAAANDSITYWTTVSGLTIVVQSQ